MVLIWVESLKWDHSFVFKITVLGSGGKNIITWNWDCCGKSETYGYYSYNISFPESRVKQVKLSQVTGRYSYLYAWSILLLCIFRPTLWKFLSGDQFVQFYLLFFWREVSTPIISPVSLPAPQILCQQFHFRLETKQNVDEFAMPPTPLWFDIPPAWGVHNWLKWII